MHSDDQFPETPSQPHASVLVDQRDANEQLVLATLRAQEDAEQAHSGRIIAESESDELRAASAALVDAAQFRERLLGIIGHDLRNPLNSIVMAAELIAGGKTPPERSVWLANRILESGQRMARMIDQLADFTRARVGGGLVLELRSCDLAVVCRNVVEELELASRKQIGLVATGDCSGTFDEDRVAEALSNLVGNELDHATEGTPVLVRVAAGGGWLVAEIENEGVGISAEQLASIFDAFRHNRTDVRRQAGHLGLGLFISREIAQAHGGTLDGQSTGGKTTFSLRLPRVPPI